MSDAKAREIAKAYIDKQFETMKKNGLETVEVSKQEYEHLIDEIAVTLKT